MFARYGYAFAALGGAYGTIKPPQGGVQNPPRAWPSIPPLAGYSPTRMGFAPRDPPPSPPGARGGRGRASRSIPYHHSSKALVAFEQVKLRLLAILTRSSHALGCGFRVAPLLVLRTKLD